jgi:hypothetical protein
MNLPVILAALSAGFLAVLVASTYSEPSAPRAVLSEAARAAQFYPVPIAERAPLSGLYRRS